MTPHHVKVPLGNRIVVIADHWIIQTGVYGCDFAQVNDVDLSIVRAQDLPSHEGRETDQVYAGFFF